MFQLEGSFVGHPLPAGVERRPGKIPFAPGTPLRREVNSYFPDGEISKDPEVQKQWTLFVLGLSRFMSLPVDQTYSYFQIAGIHGYPAVSWAGSRGAVYCHHGENDFSTWHRPYLVLYEGQIIKNMKDIIHEWELSSIEEAAWLERADTWRLPYWDWATKQALPVFMTIPEVPIFPPEGTGYGKTYKNPLWRFENPEKDADGKPLPFGQMPEGKEEWNINDNGGLPVGVSPTRERHLANSEQWSRCTGISRFGITQTGPDEYQGLEGVNDFKTANGVLNNYKEPNAKPAPDWHTAVPLSDTVDRMLSKGYHTGFGTFASTRWKKEMGQEFTQYLSLEQIHNIVHALAGGSGFTGLPTGSSKAIGHMTCVTVASLDPLFWLHHCNIDRLLACFQTLNPDFWWTNPGPEPFAGPAPDIPFYPFRHPEGPEGYWTSDMARDWVSLGYQYDNLVPRKELIKPDGTLDEAKYQAEQQVQFHQKYAATAKLARSVFEDKALSNDTCLGHDDGKWNDYIVNIVYDRFVLNGCGYTISFYLDTPDQVIGQVYISRLPIELPRPEGVVGATTTSGGCENCARQKKHSIRHKAQVSVTIPLIKRATSSQYSCLNSVKPEDVKSYLEANLKWQFVAIGGEQLPDSTFPDTHFSVWSGVGRPYSLPAESFAPGVNGDDMSEFSSFEGYTKLYDALVPVAEQ